MQLLAWTALSKNYLRKEYQKNLLLLSQIPEDQAQSLIMNQTDVSVVTPVGEDKLFLLKVLWILF